MVVLLVIFVEQRQVFSVLFLHLPHVIHVLDRFLSVVSEAAADFNVSQG